MAAYAITVFTTEDESHAKVATNLEAALEALDSTNDPVVTCTIAFNGRKWVGVLLTS
jgi:hypothetical protein